jgi:hypothetical protein
LRSLVGWYFSLVGWYLMLPLPVRAAGGACDHVRGGRFEEAI